MMIHKSKLHHTKTKADVGLAKVIADLTLKGYVPCIPLSEHQSYDLVVVGVYGRIYRLQVKYATLNRNGTVPVKYRSSWADKHGSHTRQYSDDEFEYYYAIYCAERDTILYVPNSHDCPKIIRFDETLNRQQESVHWYCDYLDLGRESSETIRRTPEMVKT